MSNIKTISSITPQKAKQILAENGMRVNEEQAGEIMKILITLATSIVQHETKLSIHKSKHR